MPRLSADARDAGYAAFAAMREYGFRMEVLLDGKPEPRAITADEEAGTVIALCVDGAGAPLSAPGGGIAAVTRHGCVEIKAYVEDAAK